MIVALSTQVYGSHNNGNHDESHFQKIQCYQEITSDSKIDYEGKPIKCKPLPIKWISSDESVELGNPQWNNLTRYERQLSYLWEDDQNLPDYLASERSQVIKKSAEKRMKYAQHCLENITELLTEKNESRSDCCTIQ